MRYPVIPLKKHLFPLISLQLSGMRCLWKDQHMTAVHGPAGQTRICLNLHKCWGTLEKLSRGTRGPLYLRRNGEGILLSLRELRIDLPLWICNLEMAKKWGVVVGVTFHMVRDAHASLTGKRTHGKKKKISNSQLGFC